MGEPLRIILLFIPLIAGAIAIFFSFQLMKRFGVPFVNSYFYYLVFLYIFGAYSLAGSGILEYLFTRMEIELKVIHSARLFSIFLGIPFISLSTFMHIVVSHIFLFIFLSWHLIPILFLNLYLDKYHGQSSSLQDNFETMLIDFSGKYEISKREREVIQLICKGQTNQEISDALFISLQTVKDHIHRIFIKTGVKNRVQLTNMIRSGT